MKATKKVYEIAAELWSAWKSCAQRKDQSERKLFFQRSIDKLFRDKMPHGAGFDSGCSLSLDHSGSEHLVISAHFHPMNDVGYYVSWVHYEFRVTPSFRSRINIKSIGENASILSEEDGVCDLDEHVEGQVFDALLEDVDYEYWSALWHDPDFFAKKDETTAVKEEN